MSVDWNDYKVYHPGVTAPLSEVSRAQARDAVKRRMDPKPARIAMLRRLVEANGIGLGSSDQSVQELNDWFVANVEADPAHPGRLLPKWYSVVNDIGLFMGDVLIERRPGLWWEFFTWGKRLSPISGM